MDPQIPDNRGRRGSGRGRGRRRGRSMARARGQIVSDEICGTLVDVLVHGMSKKEPGQRMKLNLSCFTVSIMSIIWTFREDNR